MAGSLVALGDSIVNGFTVPLANIPSMGFGHWVAEAADCSYTRYGRGGATSEVVAAELAFLVATTYDYAVVSVGTNDALQGIPPEILQANASLILHRLQGVANQIAVITVRSADHTAALRRAATEVGTGVVVVDGTLSGALLLGPDRIHPTALGQLLIADRVATAFDLSVSPSSMRVQSHVPLTYYLRHGMASVKPGLKRLAKLALRRGVFGSRPWPRPQCQGPETAGPRQSRVSAGQQERDGPGGVAGMMSQGLGGVGVAGEADATDR
ncbi:SGNH/GDSL hydrolase family protein [Sanguibacter suarezii]|uniref:SGNH/GDSL hydrolase family protein n=1 Tax=Sanguibacter suarezii TaxID=60921 RepID=UPI000A020BAA|nr:SGNH/GDSL hydrolase family protein [Sanguibacter suarezii]